MMHIPFDAPVDRRKFLAQATRGFGIGALIISGCSDDAPKERFTLTAKPKLVPMTYTAGAHTEVAAGMNFQT